MIFINLIFFCMIEHHCLLNSWCFYLYFFVIQAKYTCWAATVWWSWILQRLVECKNCWGGRPHTLWSILLGLFISIRLLNLTIKLFVFCMHFLYFVAVSSTGECGIWYDSFLKLLFFWSTAICMVLSLIFSFLLLVMTLWIWLVMKSTKLFWGLFVFLLNHNLLML